MIYKYKTIKKIQEKFEQQGYLFIHKSVKNKGRDYFLVFEKDNKETRIYCKFKKDFFMNFSKIFPNEDGLGESINKEILEECFKLKVDLLFYCYDHGDYFIYPMQIKNYAEYNELTYKQDKKNLYKKKDFTGQKEQIQEIVYCFPVKMLQNIKYLFKEEITLKTN